MCMPHHSLAPHRRLGLKIQPGNCWLNIHLFVYYDLCMFRWARNENAVCKTASLVHIVCMCVYKTYACCVVKCAFVASWQVGIVRIMDCTWASSKCLAYGAKIVSKKHLHFTKKTLTEIEIPQIISCTMATLIKMQGTLFLTSNLIIHFHLCCLPLKSDWPLIALSDPKQISGLRGWQIFTHGECAKQWSIMVDKRSEPRKHWW